MNQRPHFKLLLFILFISGFCSLAYQVVWLREFRLIFGGATPAASAVLAIFMGGLGLGGYFLGRRVESSREPARFYALIELAISLFSLITPLTLKLCTKLYILTGGSQSMGPVLSVFVQCLLAVIVLGIPCFFMGGTLPVALKFIQNNEDASRSTTALVYGINVTGAVTGAFITTFFLLQFFGNTLTIVFAGFLNLLIALTVLLLISEKYKLPIEVDKSSKVNTGAGMEKAGFTISALTCYFIAFGSGFAFFVAELVWFRMAVPLVSGSVYSIGLILTIALSGIGVGGIIQYFWAKKSQPTITKLTWVTTLFGITLMIPFWLGDYFAYFALFVNSTLKNFGATFVVSGWAIIIGLLAFLPAMFSGIQFPILMGVIGKGNLNVSSQLGKLYGINTLGAILGSLLGGFILIPFLQLNWSWKIAGIILVLMAVMLLVECLRNQKSIKLNVVPICCLILITCFIFSQKGPEHFWKSNPIGYGRIEAQTGENFDFIRHRVQGENKKIKASFDGRETTVTLSISRDWAVLTNGKSDGSIFSDASNMIMSGLVGSILHPHDVKTSCVVGLGTGETAGWLAEVRSMQEVDCIELEHKMTDLAEMLSFANNNAVNHKKVNMVYADAREYFPTSKKKYDLIVSEPSNLYRVGVCNLFTKEFYDSVSKSLNEEGVFAQWVQGYEIDLYAIELVLSTIKTVFPKVEIWLSQSQDFLIVASNSTVAWDLENVQRKIAEYPHDYFLNKLWFTDSIEGFSARCIANSDFTTWFAQQSNQINTDDLNALEFSVAASSLQKKNILAQKEPVVEVIENNALMQKMVLPKFSNFSKFSHDQYLVELVARNIVFKRNSLDAKNHYLCNANNEDFVVKMANYLKNPKGFYESAVNSKYIDNVLFLDFMIERLIANGQIKNQLGFNSRLKGTRWNLESEIFSFAEDVNNKNYARAFGKITKIIQLYNENIWLSDGVSSVFFDALDKMTLSEFSTKPEISSKLYDYFKSPLLGNKSERFRRESINLLYNKLTEKQKMDWLARKYASGMYSLGDLKKMNLLTK